MAPLYYPELYVARALYCIIFYYLHTAIALLICNKRLKISYFLHFHSVGIFPQTAFCVASNVQPTGLHIDIHQPVLLVPRLVHLVAGAAGVQTNVLLGEAADG